MSRERRLAAGAVAVLFVALLGVAAGPGVLADPAADGPTRPGPVAIAESPAVDLSAGTVRRALYELTETGILQRVTTDDTTSAGRPPSRIEPRFPTLVFRRLYDLANRS